MKVVQLCRTFHAQASPDLGIIADSQACGSVLLLLALLFRSATRAMLATWLMRTLLGTHEPCSQHRYFLESTRSSNLPEFIDQMFQLYYIIDTSTYSRCSRTGLRSAFKGVIEEVRAGDGARTRRSACLEGSWLQKHRLLDAINLHRLIEQYTLVLTHA
jgi:hypothetical protein